MQLMGSAVLPETVLETQIALALNTNAQGQDGLEHDRPPGWEAPEKAQVSTWPLPGTGEAHAPSSRLQT